MTQPMTMICLACGKPLGTGTELCYSCEQEGVTVEDMVDVDEEIAERLERYFIVSSLRCPECGDIHGTVTLDTETYTVEDFGIESVHEWELEMDKEEAWLRDNARAVRAVLPDLEPEWPRCVHAVRTRFFS